MNRKVSSRFTPGENPSSALDKVPSEYNGNGIRLGFVARYDTERRACTSDGPP